MLELTIPDHDPWRLQYLVLDVNGTVSCDGTLLPGVQERLETLKTKLSIYLLTADTHGSGSQVAETLDVPLHILLPGPGGSQKLAFVQALGADQVVAVGNGTNDASMLRAARLGIAVLGDEGLAAAALAASTVFVRHIHDGLDLLLKPQRLIATLRT